MPVRTDLCQALDINILPLPPGMRVLRIDVEDYTDWSGDPALRISVLLDESTEVEKLSGAAIGDFERAIRVNLRKHGITLFAYFSYAKPSDLEESDEE